MVFCMESEGRNKNKKSEATKESSSLVDMILVPVRSRGVVLFNTIGFSTAIGQTTMSGVFGHHGDLLPVAES